MEKFLHRLSSLRFEHSYTQEFVASQIGISNRLYSFYESGVRRVPLKVFLALADLYEVSCDYLCGRED